MLLQQEQGHPSSFRMRQALSQGGQHLGAHQAPAHVDTMVQQHLQQASNPNIDMMQLQGFLLQTMQQDQQQQQQHTRTSYSGNAGPNLHELLTGGTNGGPVVRNMWQPSSPRDTAQQQQNAPWAMQGLATAAANGMLPTGDMSWDQAMQDLSKTAAGDMPLWQAMLLSSPAAQLQNTQPGEETSAEPSNAVHAGTLIASDSLANWQPGKRVLNFDAAAAQASVLNILDLAGGSSGPRSAGMHQDSQQQPQLTHGFQVGLPNRASTPQLPVITSSGVQPGSGSASKEGSASLPPPIPSAAAAALLSTLSKPSGPQGPGSGTGITSASPGLPPLSAAMLQQLVGSRAASPGVGMEVTPVNNRPGRKPQQTGSGVASDSETSYISNVHDSSGAQPAARQGGRATRADRSSKLANTSHATDSAPPAPSRGRTARDLNGVTIVVPDPAQLQALQEQDNSNAVAAAFAAAQAAAQAAVGGKNAPGRHDMLGVGNPRSCHCKKSQCLKLYCDCFSAGVWCWSCACTDCYNRPQYKAKVIERREHIMSRDPKAFVRKIQTDGAPGQERHKKGCNCKRSHCLKKYCECYQGGVRCSISCKCTDCHNHEGSVLPVAPTAARTSSRKAPARAMDYQAAWLDDMQGSEEMPVRKSTRTRRASKAAVAATEWEYDEAADDSEAGGDGSEPGAAAVADAAADAGVPATWSHPAVALPVAPHLSPSQEDQGPTEQPAEGLPEHQEDLLLHGQVGWAAPGLTDAGAELRRILDQAGLPTTPTGLLKTGPMKGAGVTDEQQLLVLQQLNATPSTLRYPHTMGHQAATGSGASAGCYGTVIGGFMVGGAGSRATGSGSGATGGEEVEDPKREGHTTAVTGLNGSAPVSKPAAGPGAMSTANPLASALKALQQAGSPRGATSHAKQAGPAQGQDSSLQDAETGEAAVTGLAALGSDADEALLRAAPEELGDLEDADMELGSAVWPRAFSRFASTPGGVARLLASPCRTTFSLGSPLPPPDMLFPRATPSSHALGWPQDLLLTPSSHPMVPDTNVSSSTAAKKHQGVIGSVEALVTPVRTSRNGSTSGVKRTLGMMMGESQPAPTNLPIPIPSSPGLDALASLAAAEAGDQAVPASQADQAPLGGCANSTITANVSGPASGVGKGGQVPEGNGVETGDAAKSSVDGQVNPTEQLQGSGRSGQFKRLQTAGGSGDFAGRMQGVSPVLKPMNSGGGFGQLQPPPAIGNSSLIVGHVQFGGGSSNLGASNAGREVRMSSSLEALKAQASDYINSRLRAQDRKSPVPARSQPPVIPVPPPYHPIPSPPCRQNSLTNSSLGIPAQTQAAANGQPAQAPEGQAQPAQAEEGPGALRELSLQQLPHDGKGVMAQPAQGDQKAADKQEEQKPQQGGAMKKRTSSCTGMASMGGGTAPTNDGPQISVFANGHGSTEGGSGAQPMSHAHSLMPGTSLPICSTPWTFSGMLDGANIDSFLMSPGPSGSFAIWDSLLGSPMMTTPAHAKQLGLSGSLVGLSPMRGCRLFATEAAAAEPATKPAASSLAVAGPSKGTSSGSRGSAGVAGTSDRNDAAGGAVEGARRSSEPSGTGGGGIGGASRPPKPSQVTSSMPGMASQVPPAHRHANSSITSAPLEAAPARQARSSTPGLVLPGNNTPGLVLSAHNTPGLLASGGSSQVLRITPGKTLVAPTNQLPALSPSSQLPTHGMQVNTAGNGLSLLQRQHSSSKPTLPV